MATQMSKGIEGVAESLGQHAERLGRGFERVADSAAKDAGEAADVAREYAVDGFDRFEVAVRRNPLASAAVAAGVGFVLAALARR